RGIALRSIARQPMKFRYRYDPFTLRAHDHDPGFECCQRHTHIGRMRRDTLFAGPEDRMHAIESLKRTAATAWIPLVALREPRIHEIRTACALQKVSPISRQIAQLR